MASSQSEILTLQARIDLIVKQRCRLRQAGVQAAGGQDKYRDQMYHLSMQLQAARDELTLRKRSR